MYKYIIGPSAFAGRHIKDLFPIVSQIFVFTTGIIASIKKTSVSKIRKKSAQVSIIDILLSK